MPWRNEDWKKVWAATPLPKSMPAVVTGEVVEPRRAEPARPEPPPAPRAHGSFILDAVGTILAFDPNAERLTGWSAQEIVGQPKDLGVYSEPDENGVRRFIRRPLFDGRVPTVERPTVLRLQMIGRDGAHLAVEALVAPLGGRSGRISVEVQRVLARLGGAPVSEATHDGLDPLTRLPLEQAFDDRLRNVAAESRRTGEALAVLFVNIDHFDRLQDSLGGDGSNAVVRHVAGILSASTRGDDMVARFPGADFGVMLPGTARSDARQVASRVRTSVESFALPPTDGGADVGLTVSIGIACYPGDADTPFDLLRRARDAQAEAIRLGRNRVWCYTRRPRVQLELPVYFDGPGSRLLGNSRDVSFSGLFVETHDDLRTGMRVGLAFRLPGDDDPVKIVGRVVRRVGAGTDGIAALPGVGVEFERVPHESRHRLELFLEQARDLGHFVY